MFKIGDKVRVDDLIMIITGESGDFYRVFVTGANKYHDWYSKTYIDSNAA